jgi:hypothetical protein
MSEHEEGLEPTVSAPMTRVVPSPPARMSPPPVAAALQSSDEVAGIIEALCKAQAKFGTVGKDRTANITSARGSYTYSYATLSSVIAAIRPALNEQGIALVQSANIVNTERAVVLQVDTRFLHTSGQWLGSVLRLPLGDATPQGMGSLLTYLRRYGLSALAGVASEEDDDGQAAQPPTPAQRTTAPRERSTPRATPPAQTAPRHEEAVTPTPPRHEEAVTPPVLENELPAREAKPRPPKVQHPVGPTPPREPLAGPGTITQKDRNLLFKTASAVGWTEQDVKSLLLQLFKYTSTSQLTPVQLVEVMACMERPAENGVVFEMLEGQQVLVVKR